ncbi:AAA domain-containing protein [Archangium sp.]|uniref:AAA domain-containing protein n=1 Tax=Archangium sp. TaxID=1872627 RepID=UPI002D678F85|nr:AAA domain-containing protein [Archangium sp.]HYO54195.1 AAA domain-containing protein [Archangium sp.]
MLDRLYASLASGPSINCRPHNSRQRVDLTLLSRLDGTPPQAVLAGLLGEKATVKLSVRTAPPVKGAMELTDTRQEEERQALLRKLNTIAEDARTFEQDTGAQVLHVGFPLLHLPPGSKDQRGFASTKRVLAPIAFVPVRLTLKKGRTPGVELESAADGADRVMPNTALIAWVERQTGKRLGELFADEEGKEPWRELNGLAAAVANALELPAPAPFTPETPLSPTPRSEDETAAGASILPCAVLGLYPLSNQSLVDDMRAFVDGEPVQGPIESFLRVGVSLGAQSPRTDAAAQGTWRTGEDRLVSHADPCQSRAVRLARSSRGLVVHGPPGTGKSQTIANAIGDHLARGERVLLVCDKRTALDVVKHRLEHLGLGSLCAVVHDAQRDQRELYLGIREQLDNLTESKANPAARAELSRVDTEMQSLHDELSSAERALSERPAGGTEPSFHELVGQWFGQEAPESLARATESLGSFRLAEARPHEREVREVLERAGKEGYPDNPWRTSLGTELKDYLSTPLATYRERMASAVEAAREADAQATPDVPAFSPSGDVAAEGRARAELADKLERVLKEARPEWLTRWASSMSEAVQATKTQLEGLAPQVQVLNEGPLDTELALVHRSEPQALSVLGQWLAFLASWLLVARKWYRFLFFFTRRAKASEVLRRFGLTVGAETAERVSRFLTGVRARLLLTGFHHGVLSPGPNEPLSDEVLARSLRTHAALFDVLLQLERPVFASCRQVVRDALKGDETARARLVAGLRQSAARSEAVVRLEARLAEVGLFSSAWCVAQSRALREGAQAQPLLSSLAARLSSVEGLLRIQALVAGLPPALGTAAEKLALAGADAEGGWCAVRKAVLAAEASARVRESQVLQHIDADRIHASQTRYRALEARKRELVRDVILHRWTERQRDRLLASTGGRLNGLGAELRRRLLLRGERALRVRQVIAAGASVEGGDPLFDMRPVWMASPQTVAQIFPRRELFDVVIFDESSQCRLEEALPVLTRAKRVVIAGDPKQLPPTRFFESAVVQSQEELDAEDEQGLFEDQQAEVEDLLGAALNLEIDQCYLDVHYRSQNADLIGFSNEHFYDSRLQAIPGHPSNQMEHAPLRLIHAGGLYEKRVNGVEARAVGALVKELLSRPEPPSIGVACFNLAQRDAITEVLEELAAADADFAAKLATARARRGEGSFEGLFVKNLENVQGDERDHIIISTTYGPDAKGRFHRRFGPLGSAGGGRRLNVLVTRARRMVHLVTSIPREVYSALPPVEQGRKPNGGWLLFAYLQYAERLAEEYARESGQTEEARERPEPVVHERETEAGSAFARALAEDLARTHGVSSDVHWGNDGFCVDVALHHPRRPGDVTVGVLCDGTRYPKAADPVEWDLFRTAILEGQGWKLVRLWTPHFFRDPEGAREKVLQAASEQIARQPPLPDTTVRGEARRVLN